MNMRKYPFPVLLAGTGLALILQVLVRPALAKPFASSTAYDVIDAYIEE